MDTINSGTYLDDMLKMDEEEDEFSEVSEFYSGCNVLITGASGFVGKIILEKLLRSCPKMNKAFVLMRAKKGKSSEERLEKMFELPLFDRLYREQKDFMKRVMIIEGDTGESDLGLSEKNREFLQDNTHIIIHGAATVRFDETLRKVVEINVRGTKLLLELAKQMPNLKAFVHISTAFSHCTRKDIEEKFYDIPFSAEKALELIEIANDNELALITPKIIDKWPNTYAYSKAMGEEIVKIYGSELPVCIVRPSIVVSISEEPLMGWADQFYGVLGVSIGSYIGILRVLYGDENKTAEIVPADYVSNNVIVAAWDIGRTWIARQKKNDSVGIENTKIDPVIYNCVTSPQNRLTWKNFKSTSEKKGTRFPSVKMMWIYRFSLIKQEWLYNILAFLVHTMPAFIIDMLAMLTGREPILRKIYTKIHKFSKVLAYFSIQEWFFDNRNVVELSNKMSPIDKEKFYINTERLNWDQYFRSYMAGMRVYIIKDPMNTVNQAFWRYIRMGFMHYTILLIFWMFVYYMFSFVYKFVFA